MIYIVPYNMANNKPRLNKKVKDNENNMTNDGKTSEILCKRKEPIQNNLFVILYKDHRAGIIYYQIHNKQA